MLPRTACRCGTANRPAVLDDDQTRFHGLAEQVLEAALAGVALHHRFL